MVSKPLNRKKFLRTTIAGIAGIGLISRSLKATPSSSPTLRKIGNTGIMVTPVCFGASRTNEESLIKYAVEKGINFIDTGRSYSNGNNERIVGQAISGIRKNIIIQSKMRLDENELPSRGKGLKGAAEIRSALSSKLEASLKALNTDYIDIMLYHDASDENLLFHQETLKFFSEMKRTGVIRAHGFSTHNDRMNLPERNNAEKLYNVIMLPFNHKGSFIHSVTGRYSEWDQERLIRILQEAQEKGIGIIAMKTCSGGKYSASASLEPNFKEAVNWVLQHKFVCSAAIAMANFEQVDEHTPLIK
jgi:aryl-alcohol dehydrogenase-like predicted oxidoreductase